MSLSTILFTLLASVVGFSAIAVVLTQNIVRACVWLLFTLGGLAGLYFLLGAEFVGATQLLIYVGGTMVLVVFGIMLTGSEAFGGLRVKPWERQLTIFVGAVLLVTLINLLATSFGESAGRGLRARRKRNANGLASGHELAGGPRGQPGSAQPNPPGVFVAL
jgi:NADH:ubiquinone oxidoreductase subunit 6 (subunit J)